MTDWYADDSFWETFQGYMFDSRRLALTGAEVDQMSSLLGLQSGAAVLDLCCGIGRHSIEFARRGFKVTGVDRTLPYLDQARSGASKENLKIEFVQADMREFSRPAAFDGAINFFTAFGYFDDPADDAKVARNLFDSLKPGGRLIVDVVGKEILAGRFRERDWSRRDDGTIMLEERRVLDGWKRLESRWIRIRGNERREATLILRLYSGAELESVLRAAGFREVSLYGSLSAKAYDQNAERLVAVASK
jgi:SAM-dependent methyltransferase